MQEMSGQASSPRSSNEAASHNGTPETRLTAFSPEDSRVSGRTPLTLKMDYEFEDEDELRAYVAARDNSRPAHADPFLSTHAGASNAGLGPRLSPTAASFTPSTVSGFEQYAGAQLSPHGLKDKGSTGVVGTAPPLMAPIGSKAPVHKPLNPASTQLNIGSFTSDDHLTRAFAIENINTQISAEDVAEFFSVHQFPSLKAHVFSELATKGNVYVAFADVRDANLAFHKARALSQWSIRRLNPTDFVVKSKPQLARFISEFEGQVDATVYCKFEEARSHQNTTGPKLLKDILEKYGDIKAFRTLVQGALDGVSEYRVEFYDTRAADNAVFSLDTAQFGDFILAVQHHRPDQPKTQHEKSMEGFTARFAGLGLGLDLSTIPEDCVYRPTSSQYDASRLNDRRFSPTAGRFGRRDPRIGVYSNMLAAGPGYVVRTNPRTPYLQLSPTGRSTLPRGFGDGPHRTINAQDLAAFIAANERQEVKQPTTQYATTAYRSNREAGLASPLRSLPKSGGRNPNDNGVGQHNTVDVERIRQGLDVRTTIMLRNIPNKIDQAMLKGIVDETSHGKYDFMYLRIDFANNCNVGYAFINFEDPYYIIDFVKAKAGQRWNRFNSDKVAEVSYATIQGKDCLVQKFRNSSVMLEHPSFRPKIFITGTGPMAGTEDVFPGPDNPSKMRRSVENAEHVGLFAPRAGQQFRDEQRRRRSNFDRGTRLAEVEDALAAGEGWIQGDYWVRLPGTNDLVRVSSPPHLDGN